MRLGEIVRRLLPGATAASPPPAVPSRESDLNWHRQQMQSMQTRMQTLAEIAAVLLRDGDRERDEANES